MLVGLTEIPAAAVARFITTGTEALTAPGASTEMDPVYWPSGSPDGSAATEIPFEPGIDPFRGAIVSHEPYSTAALRSGTAFSPPNANICGGGVACPGIRVNVSACGCGSANGMLLTLSVIVTDSTLPSESRTETVAE